MSNTSLTDLLSALQNGVRAINNLNQTLESRLPPVTTVSTSTPTAGSITFSSSQAAGYLTVVTSSGGSYLMPVYTP